MFKPEFDSAARLSHAYILSSRSHAEGLEAARNLAAAAVCTSGGKVPCLSCRSCRKVLEGIHPDVITVSRATDSSGNPKKEITVDQVRAMVSDSYVMPNEAARKVYIVEDADLMNTQAQNAALKLLEEPPAGAMFILCVENAQQLLPTVRSRCSILNVGRSEAEAVADDESTKLAEEYFKIVASGSALKLINFAFTNELMEQRDTVAFIDCASEMAADMLCGRKNNLGLSRARLVSIYELLCRCGKYLRVNVGVKQILGLLAVDSLPDEQ